MIEKGRVYFNRVFDTSIGTMNLAAEDIRFIKEHLGERLTEQSLGKPPAVYEIELRERMIRVEEMDRRFEAMQKEMDRRLDAVERRFEMLTQRMDSFMLWLYAIILTVGGLITVAALKLLP